MGHDVLAVAALFDHGDHPGELALARRSLLSTAVMLSSSPVTGPHLHSGTAPMGISHADRPPQLCRQNTRTGIGIITDMSEHNHYHHVLNDLNPQHRSLRKMIPEVYRGFAEMSNGALTSGALDKKVKELIAMAIGVVAGCDGCIASHAQGAARAGASKEEAAEAIGVSILMHGGPATIYGARAYDAFCEFADAGDTAAGSPQ
jgi:AhpD family alkylhydroperoxidase